MTTQEARQALIDKDPTKTYCVTECAWYSSHMPTGQKCREDYQIQILPAFDGGPCETLASGESLSEVLEKALTKFPHATN